MKYAIKFCGGCNPRYDRDMYARKLTEKLKDKGTVTYAKTGESYDRLYVICGCQVCCADISGIIAKEFIYVDQTGEKDAKSSAYFIKCKL